jgi:cytoskeletal protein CcmA (bactofilin family)
VTEALAFALLLAAFVGWLLLPLIPALRELLRPTDAAPLGMVGQDAGELTFFADRFRDYVRGQIAALSEASAARDRGRLPDGTPWVRAHADETAPASAAHVEALVLAECGSRLLPDAVYAMEVYGRGDVACGDRSIVRALLSEGACDIGAGADVLRWVHADGPLRVGTGSALHGRATSDERIELEPGVRFGRLRAPRIMARESDRASELRPSELPEASGSHSRFTPPRAVRLGDGYLRVDGSLDIPPRSFVVEHLVVRGDVRIGVGSRLEGAVKAHGSVLLSEGVAVVGAVVARQDVHADRGATIAGAVIAEGEVTLARGTSVGSPELPATVSAQRVRLAPTSAVYGAITTEDGAVQARGMD